MKSEQWKWVDIAKGIGIILVFLGHFNIPDTLRAEIYTFHIPLFFFLSGVVFNGHKPINRFLGDEAKRMIGLTIGLTIVGRSSILFCSSCLCRLYADKVSILAKMYIHI